MNKYHKIINNYSQNKIHFKSSYLKNNLFV